MTNKLVPFTTKHYPKGYSRKDCQFKLDFTNLKIKQNNLLFLDLRKEKKELEKELKDGGYWKIFY